MGWRFGPLHMWVVYVCVFIPRLVWTSAWFRSEPLGVADSASGLQNASGSSERGQCRRGQSEIPHFPSELQSFARVLGENEERRKEKRRKAKKNKKKKKKKKKQKWENPSDPIYTNPIKNLPML